MIIDTIKASEAESGDLLTIGEHQMEETSVTDKGDFILIVGYSYLTGDRESLEVDPDETVYIWTE